MSRYFRYRSVVVLLVLAFATLVLVRAAVQAAAPPPFLAPPTPPPLPIPMRGAEDATRRTLPTVRQGTGAPLVFHRTTMPPGIRIPKLSEEVKRLGGWQVLNAQRRAMNASGGTIVLTGDHFNFYVQDLTLAYGTDVFAYCENMIPNTTYNYYIFTPDGTANVSGNVNTAGQGQCGADVHFNLSTPFGGIQPDGTTTTVGTDPAYSGVWALGMQNQGTGQFEAMSYIVMISAFNFGTYADAAGTTPSSDFAPGATVYARSSGLNPAHKYQMGFVYTAGTDPNSNKGLPCEYSVPAVANKLLDCYGPGFTPGAPVPSGNFNPSWPSGGTSPTGTYDVQLYDVTAKDLIGHQQFSMEPSTVSWTLTPYNSVSGNGTNLANTFATDGLLDQSVTGLTYAVTGLPLAEANKQVSLVLSDANNMALGPVAGQVINPPATATVSALGAVTFTQQPFPFSAQYQTAVGPTQTSYAPNTATAQLADVATGKVLGSKSLTLLAYQGQLAWTSPSVNILNATAAGTTQQVTITNTAGSSFATWNGDGIAGIKIAPKGGDPETLALSSTGPFTDTGGNSWNLSLAGGVITATPAVANTAIPANGTLSFPIIVKVPSGCNTTACYLQTQILPLHGIAYSAANTVTNGLGVLANGIPPNTVVPTYSYNVTGETGTAGIAPRVGSFNKMMYVLGTMGSANTDTYEITININNSGSTGGNRLMDFDMVFPASENFNLISPTLNGKVVVNGANSNGWSVQVQSQNAALPGSNSFEVWCGNNANNGCGVPNGQNAVVKIHLPIPLTSFQLQNITATANFDGGCPGGACTLPSYALTPDGTTTASIAGPNGLNSSELGAYSLNPSFMQMNFAPASIPSGQATTTTLTFTNTSTSSDPNPDYVDQINLSFPNAGIVPTSITIPAPYGTTQGWVATKTTGAGVVPAKWTIAMCANPLPATPCANPEPYAIAPGATLPMTLNYTNATSGTYAIGWYVTGANGGANTNNAAKTVSLTASNTSATAAITNIEGYTGSPAIAPTPVPGGTEPQVGTDADKTFGNSYIYTITNNGSTSITGAAITIPNLTTNFSNATDGVTYLALTQAPFVTLTGGATGTPGTCKNALNAAQYASASGGGNGNITLSGCTIPPGGAAQIYFDMKAPYLIGSEMTFSSTVTAGATVATTPTYGTATTVMVVLDGRITVITPPNGPVLANIVPLAPDAAPNTTPKTGSVVTNTGSTPTTINFGSFTGIFDAKDMVDVSVMSDANGANLWNLYVSADVNPTNGVNPQLSTNVDAPTSSHPAGFTVQTSALTYVPTTTPGLLMSTFQGTAYHNPVDSVMSFHVNTGAATSSTDSVTITYTLIPQ